MSLKTELLKHQETAFEKLKSIKVGALFMEMGTGKTRTAIELIEYRRMQGKIKKVFWICPVSTKQNLMYEIEKHSDYTSAFIEKYKGEFVCIIGIESISQSNVVYLSVRTLIEENYDCMMIVDESHMIKNHMSVRTKRCIDLSKFATYRMILTGTPITQGIWDLYCQFMFLHQKILGYNSFYSFAKNHLEYSDKFPGMITNALNTEYITAKINPYIYQVMKSECLSLPEKSYTKRVYYFEDGQGELYDEIKSRMLDEIDPDKFNSYTIFKLLGYLHRISSGYFKKTFKKKYYEDRDVSYSYSCNKRAELLNDILDEIDTKNNKVIIWYRYNSDMQLIKEVLEYKHTVFNGSLSEEEKKINLKEFKDGDVNVLVSNILSGSTGLNLQEANYMIYYNNTFDYAKRKQSEDRIHRIGQTKNCHIIDIVGFCGIDDKVMQSIRNKRSLAAEIREQINNVKDDKEKIEAWKSEMLREL